MTDDADAPPVLAAGNFSSWLTGMQGALRGERTSDVPCGGCTACCKSSQFIPIGPDETDTRSHIPSELMFPAPGLPRGHVVLGYDEHGHCPMLKEDQCSIYEHRPVACRTYDCRIFPAVGVEPDGDEQPLIARQVRRWQFGFATEADRTRHAATKAAATFLRDHHDEFSQGVVPSNPAQLVVLAVEVHDTFLRFDDDTGQSTVALPRPEVVEVAIRRRTRARDRS